MIRKLENVIKRIRWQTFFFEKKNKSKNEITNNFGFKSVQKMNSLKNLKVVYTKNIEFKNVRSNIQEQLSDDIRSIKNNVKLSILAEKTNKFYELTTDEYNKLLTKNISKAYKKSSLSTMHTINTEANNIAQGLNLGERFRSCAITTFG